MNEQNTDARLDSIVNPKSGLTVGKINEIFEGIYRLFNGSDAPYISFQSSDRTRELPYAVVLKWSDVYRIPMADKEQARNLFNFDIREHPRNNTERIDFLLVNSVEDNSISMFIVDVLKTPNDFESFEWDSNTINVVIL